MPNYVFKIARSGANGVSGVSVSKQYSVELDERMTVLDGLFLVQRNHDPSLSFRCSCRVGMCGTCAMQINLQPRLACQTRVAMLKDNVISVRPLDNLPVLKDLVVSLEPFFEKWRAIRPALRPRDPKSKVLAIVPPTSEFGQQSNEKWDCITCGSCYAACSIVDHSDKYLGPAAINKALLRLLDPRDDAVDERLKEIDDEAQGVWRCHTQFNCVAACPKGINLTDSIVRLKRAMLRPKKFHDKLRQHS